MIIETATYLIILTKQPEYREPKPEFPIVIEQDGKRTEVRQPTLGECAAWESDIVMREIHLKGVHFIRGYRNTKRLQCQMSKKERGNTPSTLRGQ